MANSVTQLVNLALIKLGQPRINSLDDNNARARTVKDIYESVRDQVLADHPWNEAIKRATLVTTTAPNWGFSNYYTLPTDFIALERHEFIDDEYRIEDGKIGTNISTTRIAYVFKLADVNRMSPQLQDTIATKLASELAIPLTGDERIAQRMRNQYQAVMNQAQYTDNRQSSVDTITGSQWLNSRFGFQPIFRPIESA